jgi:hypothetical protein
MSEPIGVNPFNSAFRSLSLLIVLTCQIEEWDLTKKKSVRIPKKSFAKRKKAGKLSFPALPHYTGT